MQITVEMMQLHQLYWKIDYESMLEDDIDMQTRKRNYNVISRFSLATGINLT